MLTCEKVLECKSMKEIESGEVEQVLCRELVLDIVWLGPEGWTVRWGHFQLEDFFK